LAIGGIPFELWSRLQRAAVTFQRFGDFATYVRPTWLRRFSYRVKHRRAAA